MFCLSTARFYTYTSKTDCLQTTRKSITWTRRSLAFRSWNPPSASVRLHRRRGEYTRWSPVVQRQWLFPCYCWLIAFLPVHWPETEETGTRPVSSAEFHASCDWQQPQGHSPAKVTYLLCNASLTYRFDLQRSSSLLSLTDNRCRRRSSSLHVRVSRLSTY